MTASAPTTLKLCYEDVDARPWRYRQGGGLNFLLLDNAARQAGLILRYEPTIWGDCLSRLRRNEVDGAFASPFHPGARADGVYPGGGTPDAAKQLYADRFVLIRRKGDRISWDGHSLSSVSGTIGLQAGYDLSGQLQSLGIFVDAGVAPAETLLRRLAAAKIAAAIALEGEARRILEHDADLRGRLEILPLALVEEPYYLMLSRAFVQSHPQQAEGLWHRIEEIRTSATYRSLEKRTLAALGQS